MSWGFGAGYGEPGSGLVSHILGKPGTTKGGQTTVIISDVDHLFPRAYIHHHKKDEKPRGWTKQGLFEVKIMLADVQRMMSGYGDGDGGKDDDAMYLWDELPHFIWDNYFSGDKSFDYMGNLRFGALMMCRQETHVKKKTDTAKRLKVARLNRLIVLVNKLETFQYIHVSF
jgi:hypothetical protein